jgi:demethoxyubiquinone hydroxylase (CLK1/Coq7/Cat5 family)
LDIYVADKAMARRVNFPPTMLRLPTRITLLSKRFLSTEIHTTAAQPKLTRKEMDLVNEMLRVNHAGEVGANTIYAGQLAVIKDAESVEAIEHMWDQEREHLSALDTILVGTRTRPSALRAVWEGMGYLVGSGSALFGKEAAMACTEAVETGKFNCNLYLPSFNAFTSSYFLR